jgi:hypothetical protein
MSTESENQVSNIEDQSDLELTVVAHFGNAAMAQMACEMMRNNGLRATLTGAHFGALEPLPLPGGFSEISLLVAKEDFERAQEIYAAFFEGDGRSEIDQLPDSSPDRASDD